MVEVLDKILTNDDATKDAFAQSQLWYASNENCFLTLLIAEQHHDLSQIG